MWEADREEFFLRYLADTKPPRVAQTEPMAVGSAFDAKVKGQLCQDLGMDGFTYEELFESQVERQNRDFAREAGEHVFECYRYCGAYRELRKLLEDSDGVKFESTAKQTVCGVPLLGKPDLLFLFSGLQIVLDWKVKGYCSKNSISPTRNYRLCRDGQPGRQSRSHGKTHSGYLGRSYRGFEANTVCFSVASTEYADQLSLYGWLLGVPVGSDDAVFMIDEIVCKNAGSFQKPILRIANHRARVEPQYQKQLLRRYRDLWETIQSGEPLDRERMEILNAAAEHMDDDEFGRITRRGRF